MSGSHAYASLPQDGTHEPRSPSQGPGPTAQTPALPSAHLNESGPRPQQHASGSQLHPASKRFFLDVFAGRLRPATSAAISLGLDCFQPFDLGGDTAHNILDDSVFEALLRLCWSGIVP